MIKSIALIKRKPGLSREAFVRHYEEIHVPLALHILGEPFVKYRRNYLMPGPDGEDPPYDVLSEFWFEDDAALARLHERNASPAARALREDEASFMDVGSIISYRVDERGSPDS